MAQETFLVVVKEDGTVEVSKKIKGIGDAAKGSTDALGFLKRTLATLGIGLGIRELAQYSDSYTEVTNNIQKNVKSIEELNAVQSRLFDISQRTRTNLENNADLYDRLAGSASDLGVSQNQLLKFLEATNIALRLQSGSSELSRRSIIQLFQTLRSGNVDAAELNGILKQTPDLAQAAADGIAEAGGSVAKLTSLIASGKVSARGFFDAVNSQVPELQEKFARLTPTIGSAFTVLNNSMIKFVGELSNSTKAGLIFGNAILFIADNIETFAKGIALAGIALATYFAPSFILKIVAAVKALTAALLANPFTAIITGIALAVSALILFREEISKLSEPTKEVILDIARFLDATVSGFYGAVNAIGEAWSHLGPILGKHIIDTANIVLGGIQALIDNAAGLLNQFSQAFGGAGAITPPRIVLDNPYENAVKEAGEAMGKVYAQSAGTSFQDAARNFLTPNGAAGGAGGTDLDTPLGAGTVTLTQQQASAFDQLLKSLNPVKSAMEEVAKAQELINLAQAAGVINAQEATKLNELLTLKYKDQLDPLRAVNEELDRQAVLLKQTDDQRAISNQLYDLTKQLQQQGIVLTAQETEQLKGKLEALQQLNKESQIQDEILRSIKGPAEDYANTLTVLNRLLNEGSITQAQYNEKLRDSRIAFLETQTDAAAGFERAILKMQKSAGDLADVMEQGLTSAIDHTSDALADFAMTGQLNFKQLVNSILSDITRLAAKQATSQIFGGLFGGGGGGGGIFGSLFGGGGGGGGGIFGSLFSSLGFDNGGSFTIGGVGGPDSQMVNFRGTPGETVTVHRPGEGASNGKPATIIFNISTPDANSFNRSQSQLMARAQASLVRAQRRNG